MPGSELPDNAIHRASLWVEGIKYAIDQRVDAEPDRIDEFEWRAFIEESGLPVTVEQLQQAVVYYGLSTAGNFLGGRVNIAVPAPGGGLVDLRSIFASVWYDGFMHGVATAQGRRGQTSKELGLE